MISIVVSTHGDSADLPILLSILDRQRVYYVGIPEHAPQNGAVMYLAGDYLKPFENKLIEVIVVSHGKTRKFSFDERSMLHKFIELPKVENSYGHHCREEGIKQATGDWIVCTSADNLFMGGWLHFVMEAIKDPQVGMVNYSVVNNYSAFDCGKNYKKHLIERGCVDMCSCVVRADIAKKVGFPFRNFDGDADFLLACAAKVKSMALKIKFLPEILACHQ